MFCRFCGSEVDNDSLYCSVCGKIVDTKENSERSPQLRKGGKYCKAGGQVTTKRRRFSSAAILIVLALIIVGVMVVVLFCSDIATEKAITTVQSGYLGEFTNLTVKEILDNSCGLGYKNSEWDGGTTDAGKRIVQVRYYSDNSAGENIGETTIQFTMLDNDRFKVTALVDPVNPIKENTDIFAILNEYYYLAYLKCNSDKFTNEFAMQAFINGLNEIKSSEVVYGASANYNGNRAKLGELDGQVPFDVSVAMLLDNWGTIDLLASLPGGENDEGSTVQTNTPKNSLNGIEFVPYSVDDLTSELHNNALRASQRFQDQYIELTGELASIDVNGEYLALGACYDEFSWDTILCYFTQESQRQYITAKNTGDIITVQCKVTEINEVLGYYVDIIDYVDVQANYAPEENTPIYDGSNEENVNPNEDTSSDFMVGEYWNLEDNKFFWIRSEVTSNGNTMYWLEYPLGDGDGQGNVDKLVVPSTEYIPGNHGHSIYFHISDHSYDFYGDFEVSGYYTEWGIDYAVCADVAGLFDTGGERATVIGPQNEWGQD